MSINIDAKEVAAEAIQDVASVVSMHQSKWGTEKVDNQTTQEVKQAKGASGRAGRYKVNLANGFESELRTLTRPMSRAYHYYLRNCMQWKEGERLIPNLQLVEFLGEMQKHLDDLNDAKAALLPKLPGLIQKAVSLNGALGNITDYPTPQEILDAYSFTFDFEPIPAVDAFGNMPEGFQDKFSDSYTSRVQRRMREGVEDIIVRAEKLISDFLTVLGRDKPKFFQSSLDNVKQLAGTLRGANLLVDNDDIKNLCDQLEYATQYSAEQLRMNQNARLAAQASAQAAATIMASLLGTGSECAATQTPSQPEPEPSTLDPLLGPEDEPVDELLGDLMPELNEPSTVEGTTPAVEEPEYRKQTPREMLAEVAAMDVDDEDDIDPEIASIFNL